MQTLIVISIAVTAPLIVLALGIPPLLPKRRGPALAAEIAAHAIAWCVIAIAILSWVPKFEAIFDDFNTDLNAFARLLMRLGKFACGNGLLHFISSLIGVVLIDAAVFYSLWREPPRKSLHKIWSIIATAIPFVALASIEVGLLLPLWKLLNDLS